MYFLHFFPFSPLPLSIFSFPQRERKRREKKGRRGEGKTGIIRVAMHPPYCATPSPDLFLTFTMPAFFLSCILFPLLSHSAHRAYVLQYYLALLRRREGGGCCDLSSCSEEATGASCNRSTKISPFFLSVFFPHSSPPPSSFSASLSHLPPSQVTTMA